MGETRLRLALGPQCCPVPPLNANSGRQGVFKGQLAPGSRPQRPTSCLLVHSYIWARVWAGLAGSPLLSRPSHCQRWTAEWQGGRWKSKQKPSQAAAQPGRESSVSSLHHPSPEGGTGPPRPPYDSDLPAKSGPCPPPEKEPIGGRPSAH